MSGGTFDYVVEIAFPDGEDKLACKCGSCSWTGTAADVAEIESCSLTPGDPSPAGRCPLPDCGSLVYLVAEAWPCTLLEHIERINATAQREGWAIFNDSEIQRIDSQDIEGAVQLADDDAAMALVKRRAAQGSTLHLLALGIVGAYDPTGDEEPG